VDILTPLLEACDNCPFLLDTDVNVPAASEFALANDNAAVGSSETTTPAAAKISSCAYVTVGTGVGVGLVVNGKTVKGFMHPEGGHVPVPPLSGDTFGGYSWGQGVDANVPFSGINTVEALASSVALMERYEQELTKIGAQNLTINRNRQELANVPDESDIWDHAVNAIATLCTTMILLLSMERIVLGGGVMQRPMLLPKIRVRTQQLLNNYVKLDKDTLDRMIVVSAHGKDAGYVYFYCCCGCRGGGDDGWSCAIVVENS
jgi:fructokinase